MGFFQESECFFLLLLHSATVSGGHLCSCSALGIQLEIAFVKNDNTNILVCEEGVKSSLLTATSKSTKHIVKMMQLPIVFSIEAQFSFVFYLCNIQSIAIIRKGRVFSQSKLQLILLGCLLSGYCLSCWLFETWH